MDKKTTEKAVASFQLTVDLIQTYAIFSLDPHGLITSWNEGAEKITGWRRRDVIGKSYSFLYPDIADSENEVARCLASALQHGEYEEIGFRQKNKGVVFLADVSISRIDDEETGKVIGFVQVIKDITSQRKLEDAQMDANRLLRQEVEQRKKIEAALKLSNEELDIFATAASHDLQEPLRMVVSYLQLIERRYGTILDTDGKEFLAYAVDGATRMKLLINDLVEYSRINTQAKQLIPTNAEESLLKAIKNSDVLIEENSAHITHDRLPVVISDEVQLTQLFQNLLVNAIKFRGKGSPRVHVGVSEEENEWRFSVSDNGSGIEQKHLDDIFVIFKQLGKRSERKGSGIGLAIAKKIVGRHGGRIWAESEVGKGTTMYFTIPKQQTREESHG